MQFQLLDLAFVDDSSEEPGGPVKNPDAIVRCKCRLGFHIRRAALGRILQVKPKALYQEV
jgi:hypothetical protein